MFNLFKKKDPIEKEIKKYPRKRRARLRFLYNQYKEGKIVVAPITPKDNTEIKDGKIS